MPKLLLARPCRSCGWRAWMPSKMRMVFSSYSMGRERGERRPSEKSKMGNSAWPSRIRVLTLVLKHSRSKPSMDSKFLVPSSHRGITSRLR